MYYHCRPIKYVKHGKVFPPPYDSDDFMMLAYKWLSNYCGGYCPQIWLSRSNSWMTGYKNDRTIKKRKNVIAKRSESKESKDSVMFGFDIIKGFDISYEHWELILSSLINNSNFNDQNKAIIESLNRIVDDYKRDNEEIDYIELIDWVKSGNNLDTYLKKYVFKEVDQVVVPSLNLKSAKKIICRNEKQKKKLRKMGFIEDRIIIKNLKGGGW